MKSRDILAVFNRGRISRLALARTDVSRVALSAEVQTNWMPRTLGAMSLRPGLQYIGQDAGDGASIPFVFSRDDTARIELTPNAMRVWDGGNMLVERPSVAATVTNGLFATDLSGWTDASDAGGSGAWVAGGMQLVGSGTDFAKYRQQVTVVAPDLAASHSLAIEVGSGSVLLRVGTTAGADDIFPQSALRTGQHSINFTPGGSFWIEFSTSLKNPTVVRSCEIAGSGPMVVRTPWATVPECKSVRWTQSGDVIFCAAAGKRQQRIERRENNSWSVVDYDIENGPFLTENVTPVTLTPSALSGQITVTASAATFKAGHVGALFRLSSQGQRVESNLTAENTYTGAIRVTGVDKTRIFQVIRAGTWSGTLTLQRSIGEIGSWEDVNTYNGNGTKSFNDELDNSIVYYRIGFNTGDFTSGTAEVALDFGVGSITGTVRVTGFTSETEVSADVLVDLGATEATEVWAEGAWSDAQTWPSAVTITEDRLWWSGDGKNWGSVSDAFSNFDPDFEGDGGPISRTVGEGSVNSVNWMLPLQRLIVGTDGGEYSVRSNSFDEPITPSNYNSKAASTKGSGSYPAVYADGRGYFIDRTGRKIYELEYDPSRYDFSALDATLLVPEIGDAGFVRLAYQINPDTRVHGVRADGTVAVMVRDAAEDVLCWVDLETDGEVQDVIVLPSGEGDRVFYRIKRNINGVDVFYNEEMAREDQCTGGAANCQADSYREGSGPINTLDHLEGETVVIWGDGQDRGEEVVSGGAVSGSYGNWVAGLPYEATYKSAKLAGQTSLGLSLTQRSRINAIGLILADTHAQGIQYGPDLDLLDDMPLYEDGAAVDQNAVWSMYDQDMIEFPGEWNTDNRVCLKAAAPRPCTVLAAVLNVDRHDKA